MHIGRGRACGGGPGRGHRVDGRHRSGVCPAQRGDNGALARLYLFQIVAGERHVHIYIAQALDRAQRTISRRAGARHRTEGGDDAADGCGHAVPAAGKILLGALHGEG